MLYSKYMYDTVEVEKDKPGDKSVVDERKCIKRQLI